MQMKNPYVFDGEHGIALHAMQGIGPHLAARRKSPGFFRVVVGTWGIFSNDGSNGHSKLLFVQQCQDSCLVTRDTSGIYMRLACEIRTLFEVRRDTKGPFLVEPVILGFLSIFKKSQESSPFEALSSTCLSRCQRDVRPPVQMRC